MLSVKRFNDYSEYSLLQTSNPSLAIKNLSYNEILRRSSTDLFTDMTDWKEEEFDQKLIESCQNNKLFIFRECNVCGLNRINSSRTLHENFSLNELRNYPIQDKFIYCGYFCGDMLSDIFVLVNYFKFLYEKKKSPRIELCLIENYIFKDFNQITILFNQIKLENIKSEFIDNIDKSKNKQIIVKNIFLRILTLLETISHFFLENGLIRLFDSVDSATKYFSENNGADFFYAMDYQDQFSPPIHTFQLNALLCTKSGGIISGARFNSNFITLNELEKEHISHKLRNDFKQGIHYNIMINNRDNFNLFRNELQNIENEIVKIKEEYQNKIILVEKKEDIYIDSNKNKYSFSNNDFSSTYDFNEKCFKGNKFPDNLIDQNGNKYFIDDFQEIEEDKCSYYPRKTDNEIKIEELLNIKLINLIGNKFYDNYSLINYHYDFISGIRIILYLLKIIIYKFFYRIINKLFSN